MQAVLIAGTHSGCGKTTVTLGIMAALRKKGLAVQPFKTGPDFIDSGLHRLVVERPSRNLDVWMCGQEYVIGCFNTYASGADISVIEGVMGMYDGEFSSADLARLLQVPVVLVVDAYGMAESAGAIVQGFAEFGARRSGSAPKPAGVIFNRVASENHYKRLKDSVRDIPVLGYLPRELDFEIPHRHLGLATAEENPIAEESMEKLAETVLGHIDIDRLMGTAGQQKKRDCYREDAKSAKKTGTFTVAVAYDKAFSFYYEDNFDLLRDAGADIVRFSPLNDAALPEADALYIGGGYPELHAEKLSRNTSMTQAIRSWSDAGKPIYAECGGLMYLSEGILDFENILFPMAGVFPFRTRMMKKPKLAYREIILNEDCILGRKGERCRGHEFHYSEIECGERNITLSGRTRVYSVRDRNDLDAPAEGFRAGNTLASYIHVHFGSNPNIAKRFVTRIIRE